MFEHLDDPNAPIPAPVDAVVARGKQLRLHRRLVIGATALFVIAGTITTVAALQSGGGGKRVQVTTEPSSTTEPPTTVAPDSTVPDSTAPTTDTTPPTTVGVVAPSTPATTTTTQPPHDPNDLSMVKVSYEGTSTLYPSSPNASIPTGEEQALTYTVNNDGPWDVNISSCADNAVVPLWSNPATQAWPPYSDGIWPMPDPAPAFSSLEPPCQSTTVLPAGQFLTRTVTLLAGYQDAAGNVMPAPPGLTAWVAPLLPQCTQPCDYALPNAAHITIDPPDWPAPPSIYSIVYKTQHMSIPSGQSGDAEIVYTNGLAFQIQIPLYGPCWHDVLGNATVDCSGPRPVLTIGPHETADLHGTVWAREGFVQSGAPLANGRYMINMGDRRSETLGEAQYATWVDVT